ncbi:MAG TPA: translesion error-prone DNA polymerase V autoproteolytic subunit [Flavobacterium sp.]|uniref:LexA family protein n=1 Tax=Flavobacterium sp. TaxID=239 RepID=UPI002C1ED3F4|nr:translesion error-prone DNA polymerase V autoproteolytic subunit [Flavobacterium sp.]HSD13157.1 translesion error-prone DNA polymerase V autoproteolytic subunit [Flavobacterium sp.]
MSVAKPNLTFFRPDFEKSVELPLIEGGIKAGFPSPAADFDGSKISLDALLIKNKEATFYARASGNSMTGAGIDDGDILVIDRSLEPSNNKIAVCCIDGEFTVKRIKIETDCVYLVPENDTYKPIKVTEDNQLLIWGIVTFVVKSI